jgi:hypothetical protein
MRDAIAIIEGVSVRCMGPVSAKVFKGLVMKKGNIQVTIEEAIDLWIKAMQTSLVAQAT